MIKDKWRLAGLVGYALVLGVRLWLATQPPINSTDLLRYMGYGEEFWTYGLTIYNYPPRAFGETAYSNLWPDLQFIYPAMAMLFFGGVAKIWAGLFFPKLILSLLELLNSWLIDRYTGQRWLGLAYFANPISLWWVSGEGQYEPLVVLFTLLGLLALKRGRPNWGFGWLALGIQAKYWPGVLLPYFVKQARHWQQFLIFGLAFLPSILFTLGGDYIFHIIGSDQMAAGCNPFYWDITDETLSCWTPLWHLGVYALATYGILGTILLGLYLDRRQPATWLNYAGVFTFLVYYKSINWAAAWYLPVFLPFALPIERPWLRWAILIFSLAEPVAWAGLAGAPIGWLNPEPPFALMWGGI